MAQIETLLVVHTTNLSKASTEWLDKLVDTVPTPLSVYRKGDHGWWLHTEYLETPEPMMVPTDVIQLLDFARAEGCDWVVIEDNRTPIEELPAYSR